MELQLLDFKEMLDHHKRIGYGYVKISYGETRFTRTIVAIPFCFEWSGMHACLMVHRLILSGSTTTRSYLNFCASAATLAPDPVPFPESLSLELERASSSNKMWAPPSRLDSPTACLLNQIMERTHSPMINQAIHSSVINRIILSLEVDRNQA